MRKVGIPFNPGVGVDPDLTGLADTFSASYRLEGSTGAFTTVSGTFTEEYAGFYTVPVTINAPGSYLFRFESTDSRIGIHEGYVQVTNTSLDDLQTTIDNVASDLASVKTQVDLLDEATLNTLSGKIGTLQSTVDQVNKLMKDTTDQYVEISGDETALLVNGATITGSTSGATGAVYGDATYDSAADVTKVTLTNTNGTYQVGETVTDGTNTSTGKITTTTTNIVNSVYEFVDQINKALLNGGSSLDVLRAANRDIEHMLKGDDTLEDGSANPTAGKGLIQIFDELVSTHSDLTALKSLAEDTTVGFSALRSAIDSGISSISAQINALNDTSDSNSLASKLNTINTIVTNNKNVLGDSNYGNQAIKSAIDSLASGNNQGTQDILNALNDATYGLKAIKTDILNKLDSMDNKLDTIISTQTATVATRVVL